MSESTKSLYRQCVAALGYLRERPPYERGGVFTELDVQMRAAILADPQWTDEDHRLVLHASNEVCATQYRRRKLCRYGPVILDDGSEDYARMASKIIYADADTGPEVWKTPNGNFPKLMLEDDELGRQGRRTGTDRDDSIIWSAQQVQPRKIHPRNPSAHSQEEIDWERRIDSLAERVRALEEAYKARVIA